MLDGAKGIKPARKLVEVGHWCGASESPVPIRQADLRNPCHAATSSKQNEALR